MFESIRKHQSWLWMLIGAVVIISFIWYFLPNQNPGDYTGSGSFGHINGRTITRQDYDRARSEVVMGLLTQYGPQVNREAISEMVKPGQIYQRLFLQAKAKEYGIKASPEAVGKLARERLQDLEQTGIKTYDQFLDIVLTPRGYTRDDFNRYMRQEVVTAQLMTLLGASGKLASPKSIQEEFAKERETVNAEVLYFPSSNFLSKVEIKPEDLQTFYTNRMAFYREPEQRRISYVAYPATNFFAEADKQIAEQTNFNAIVDQQYTGRGADTYKDDQDKPLTAEAAKLKIKEEIRNNLAMGLARKKALELASDVIELETKTLADFDTKAAARQLKVQVTEPFQRTNSPTGIVEGTAIAEQAFDLTLEEPFAGPLRTEAAWYVISLKEIIPSKTKPFEAVQKELTEDFKTSKAREMVSATASNFLHSVTNAAPAGKDWNVAAKESNLQPIAVSFSSATPLTNTVTGDVTGASVSNQARNLTAGQTSRVIATKDGAYLIHVKSRTPADANTIATDLPAFLDEQRSQAVNMAFQEWFSREINAWLSQQPPAVQEQLSGPTTRRQ